MKKVVIIGSVVVLLLLLIYEGPNVIAARDLHKARLESNGKFPLKMSLQVCSDEGAVRDAGAGPMWACGEIHRYAKACNDPLVGPFISDDCSQ